MRRFFLLIFTAILLLQLLNPLPPVQAVAPDSSPVRTLERVRTFGGPIYSGAAQGDLLFAGMGHSIVVLDTRSPNHFDQLGQSQDLPGEVHSVVLHGTYLYAALYPQGLAVFDVSAPTRPILIDQISNVPASLLFPLGEYLYAAVLNQTETGDSIFSLADPANPAPAGSFLNEMTIDVSFSGSRAYFLTAAGIRLVDFSDPSAPQELGCFNLAWNPQAVSIAADGDLAAVLTQTGLHIVSFADPTSPQQLNDGKAADSYAQFSTDSFFQSGYLYVAGVNELEVYDLSQPALPVRIANPVFHANSVTGIQVLVHNSRVLVMVGSGGIHLIDLTDILNSHSYNPFNPSSFTSFKVHQGFLYSIRVDNGITISNLSDPQEILWNSRSILPCDITGYQLNGTLLSVICNLDAPTVVIFDISSPAHTKELTRKTLEEPGLYHFSTSITMLGSYVYVSIDGEELITINFSDPASPQITSQKQFPGTSSKLEIFNTDLLAYYPGNSTLSIYSLQNPAEPTLVSSNTVPETINDLIALEGNRYLAGVNYDTLAIYDAANPAALTLVGQMPIDYGYSTDALAVNGPVLYMGRYYGIYRIDVSDPANPVLLSSIPGGASQLLWSDPYLYTMDNSGQLSAYLELDGLSATLYSYETGSLTSEQDQVEYSFPPNTFQYYQYIVTHTPVVKEYLPLPAGLSGIERSFSVRAQPSYGYSEIFPVSPYSLRISYGAQQIVGVDETSLNLYSWNGIEWVSEPSAVLDTTARTITATPTHMGRFAVFGTALPREGVLPVFLPLTWNGYSTPDLFITHLELNQEIQRADNSVPLIAGKPTMLRIHARAAGSYAINHVYAQVTATRDGAPLPGSPITLGPWAVFSTPDRSSMGGTFNVRLPDTWLQGNVQINVALDPAQAIAEPIEDNNLSSVSIQFHNVAPIKIVLVPVNYTHIPTNTTFPGPTDDRSSQGPLQYYPISAVEVSFHAPMAFSGDLSQGSEWNRLLNAVTDLRTADGAPSSTLYYGVVPSNMEGVSTPYAGLGWIGLRVSIGFQGVLTHEGGHNLGLWHAPCHVDGDPAYPYPNGIIGQWGINITQNRPISPYTYDIMSYCGGDAFSDYHYIKMFNNLTGAHAAALNSSAGPALLVRATLDASGATQMEASYRLPSVLAESTGEDVTIELLDVEGNVVSSSPAGIIASAEESPSWAVRAAVPLPDVPIASVRIVKDGAVLAQRELSGQSPEPIPAQITGGPGSFSLTWSDFAPALVQMSTDGGQSWQTIAVDAEGGQLILNNGLDKTEGILYRVILAE